MAEGTSYLEGRVKKKKRADDMNEYTNNQSFRGFSVGCCINEEKVICYFSLENNLSIF